MIGKDVELFMDDHADGPIQDIDSNGSYRNKEYESLKHKAASYFGREGSAENLPFACMSNVLFLYRQTGQLK